MKITSTAHQDSHVALLGLVVSALLTQQKLELLSKARVTKLEAEAAAAKAAMPWYKRLFMTVEACTDWERHAAFLASENILFLRNIQRVATYELTIHLDDTETAILFRRLTDDEYKEFAADKRIPDEPGI